MQPIKATGFISIHGRLTLSDEQRFKQELAAHPDTAVEVTVEKIKDGISGQQRKYFFAIVVGTLHAFFLSTGTECTKQDVLDFLKDRFLFREKLSPIDGRFHKVPISLGSGEKALTKEEFNTAKEAIQMWASTTLNLVIEDPDKNYKMYKEPKE